jgi:hypothetical protein
MFKMERRKEKSLKWKGTFLLLPFHFEDFCYRLCILKISPIAFTFRRFLLSPFHFKDFSHYLSILKMSKSNGDRRNLQNGKAIGDIFKMERR